MYRYVRGRVCNHLNSFDCLYTTPALYVHVYVPTAAYSTPQLHSLRLTLLIVKCQLWNFTVVFGQWEKGEVVRSVRLKVRQDKRALRNVGVSPFLKQIRVSAIYDVDGVKVGLY